MTTYGADIDFTQFTGPEVTLEIIAVDASANANTTDTTPITLSIFDPTTPVIGEGRPTIEVDIAFGRGPFSFPRDDEWVDVTDDVLMSSKVVVTRGASADNPQPTPGSIAFTLIDQERKYDPLNGDGPYYGQLTIDCPCRVVANYTNLPVPLVSDRPLVGADSIVASGSSTVPLAYGYIEGFKQTYPDASAGDHYVTIPISAPGPLAILGRTSFLPVHPFTCVDDAPDGSALVSTDPLVSDRPLVGAGTAADYCLADAAIVGDPKPVQPQERSGTRIQTLCELAGIPDGWLDIDTGQSQVEGGLPQETNLLDHFRTVAATEYGRLDESSDGMVRFRERRSNEDRLTTTQANFCEIGGLGIPYATLDIDPADRRFLVNRCIRSSQTVPQVIVQDQDSIERYGPPAAEDSQTLAFADPQDAIDQAQYKVARFSDAPARITGLTVKPDRSPTVMFPTVIQLDLGNVYTAERTPLGQGDAIVKTITAELFTHTFDQVSWETYIDAGEADTDPYFTADDPILGLVDAGNLVAY